MKRFFYLLLFAVMLIAGTSCKKESKPGNNSGNVTGNPVGVDPPTGANDGVTFINAGKSVIFNLYAPSKTSVSVIGDFNNWTANTASAMKNSKDGTRWWVQIDNLDPSKEYAYQYLIDGNLKVADPYTNKVLDPANDPSIPTSVYPNLKAYPSGQTGIVSTFWYSAPAYTWKTTNFTRPAPKNLVVYELLVRDFVGTHAYKTLTDTLNYLVRLGVNAVELMPVNEFEGNDSWGYNSNFMFALDKYYGTPNDYKAFIDACHAKGIAVVQDIVLEDQFGSSPLAQMYWNSGANAPAANNPWLDVTIMHPDGVGYQMNHQSTATQNFTKDVMKYWMQEYHIDGYRFDQAKGFTQTNSGSSEDAWAAYDASRVAIWKNYNTYMKSIDPNFYVILEYFAGNQEESELASEGMMMWTNLSTPGEQATMGYPTGPVWDISGLFYDGYGFTAPYGLVAYFESHDQERLQFKNGAYGNSSGSYNVKDLPTGLKRDELGAAFMFSSPGPKMVWQFGERGYDISIDNGGRLGDKDPHWEYMQDPNRAHLFGLYAKMIKWKINNPVFTTTNFSYSLTGAFKWIQLKGTDGTNVEVTGNFDVVPQPVSVAFPATGTWTDNITGTTINVTSLPYNTTMLPGEYHVYSNTPLK
ncbi:alpha-amylase family glycosyl hydrolase [Mucilaginibacter sp. McL0603]|uniref:alpha-amylase family glycosyl hydrolase n=1 Tax=Mucilaginibacter sp. McL0603 TaxID=3415670 RepID=UPI003CE9DF34